MHKFKFYIIFLSGVFLLVLLYMNLPIENNKTKRLIQKSGHVTSKAHLSKGHVNVITQDKEGFIWYGSWGGLFRYDGYELLSYRPHPNDLDCIKARRVRYLFTDSQSNLWVGSMSEGLHKYNPNTGCFIQYKPISGNPGSISQTDITKIWEDEKGTIWAASHFGHLHKSIRVPGYPDSLRFENYTLQLDTTKYESKENSIFIQSIYRDKKNIIWLGTTRGLFRLDMEGVTPASFSKKITHFNLKQTSGEGTESIQSSYKVNSIQVEASGNVWAGTNKGLVKLSFSSGSDEPAIEYFDLSFGNERITSVLSLCQPQKMNQNYLWMGTNNGLFHLHKQKMKVGNYLVDSTLKKRRDKINYLYEDKMGVLWIGSNRGIQHIDQLQKKFVHIKNKNTDVFKISNNDVRKMVEDHDGYLWVSTSGGGLNRVKLLKNSPFPTEISSYSFKTVEHVRPPDFVEDMDIDSAGVIWVVTEGGGVVTFDSHKITPEQQKIDTLRQYTSNRSKLSHNYMLDVCVDSRNDVWIGTYGEGLNRYDRTKDDFIVYQNVKGNKDNINLSQHPISKVLEDYQGNLWLGTRGGGIYSFFPNDRSQATKEIFKHYIKDEESTNTLPDNHIADIYEDSKHRLWIGTEMGLCYLDSTRKQFYNIVPEDKKWIDVRSIQEDKKGNLWLGTRDGLYKFVYNEKTKKATFQLFGTEDKIQDDYFNDGAAYRTSSGMLAFGGVNGFNIFDPQEIHINSFPPQLVITSFKVNHSNTLLVQEENKTIPELMLNYKDRIVSFEFTGIHFSAPQKNKYAYKMEGFDEDWIQVSSDRRYASYTNLPSGTYIFKVKAANSDGLWDEKGIQIHIFKSPPWWGTIWFKVLLLLLFGGIIVGIFLLRIKVLQRQKEKLEITVQNRTIELREKNDEVLLQAEELQQQTEELRAQRDFIESKNKQIHQSIHAAKTIQKAILPHQEKLKLTFKEFFIINQPKDIVSGDFYWLNGRDEESTILVVADCTGHGVPGAFMTLIGNTLLDKIVRVWQIISPDKILDKLHQEIGLILKQKYTNNNYGMDLVVIKIEKNYKETCKLTFAGAKNPIYYQEANTNKVKVIKGSRKAVGGEQNEDVNFQNHEVMLPKGSYVYAGSDGFIDQNNKKRKRIGMNKLVEILEKNSQSTLQEQKEILLKKLGEYMEGTSQRDDILLLGFQV